MLLCGFSETDITPEKPSMLVGFYRPDNLSRGILKPLTAQISVWEDRERSCLITVDSIGFTKELSDILRNKAAQLLGISAEQVMLCFSHTHAGPDPDQDRDYFADVCAKITAAASRAVGNMRPVSVGWKNAYARIGVNRRPVSDQTDDRIGILKVCDANSGTPELLILRVTAHGNVLKRDNYLISPDYFGELRETVENAFGCPVMVIQGSAGNIAPRYFCSEETPVDAQSPACIRSNNALQDMADTVLQSISGVMSSIGTRPDCRMHMYSRHLKLTAPVPTEEEARITEEQAGTLCGIVNPCWMEKVRRLQAAGITEQTEDVEIQYFSIGDWCMCGGPYEFMVGFALETKKQLNNEFFYMNGYTNGCLLYFPTEDELAYGGYEVYWSMLIYFIYIDRVYPFRKGSADRLIRFVVDNKKSCSSPHDS